MNRNTKSHQKGKIKNISKFIQKFSKQFDHLESKTSSIKTNTGKRIKKIKAGKRDWSPKYKQITGAIRFWRRVKRWKSGRNTSRKIMKEMAKELDIEWEQARRSSHEDAHKEWMKALKKYHSTKHLHEEWRK